MNKKGWVCIPAVRIGIILPPAFSLLVRSKTNEKLAREIILEGKKFGGKEAESLGIVDKAGKSMQLKRKKSFILKGYMIRCSFRKRAFTLLHSICQANSSNRPNDVPRIKKRIKFSNNRAIRKQNSVFVKQSKIVIFGIFFINKVDNVPIRFFREINLFLH